MDQEEKQPDDLLEEIPEEVGETLRESGADLKRIRFAISTDMSAEGRYEPSWLVLSGARLFAVPAHVNGAKPRAFWV